jgi:diguanylate cyclase (GGDEF)-like protein
MSMLRAQWQDLPAISVRVRNIAELMQRRKEIERLAYFDPLTGLANSNLLRERADVMLGKSLGRRERVHFILLQIVRWERVFDIQGYRIAESLIQQIGARLQQAFSRHEVTLARVLGGVELGLLFDDSESPEQIVEIAHAAFDPVFHADGEKIHLRVRSGSAQAPHDAVNFKDLTKRAGLALRNANLRGMTHCQYDPTQSSRIQDERLLEDDLRGAIGSTQISLRYQPVRSIARQGAWSAVEALVRWHHPQLGEVAPTDFIPLAEESELILALDRYVLGEACAAAAGWHDVLGPLRVSVNISAVTLMHADVLTMIQQAIETSGILPSQLCLEVTETTVIRDLGHAVSVLQRLHELGVYIALDDFGTGFSSLAYLKDLPVDVLKIDRDFIRGIGLDTRDERTITAIIQLGHDLGIKVVAEGVEKSDQYRWLALQNVDFVQGFHVGLPVTLQALRRQGGDRATRG